MISRTTDRFWSCYRELPVPVKTAIIMQATRLSRTSGYFLRDQRSIDLADLNPESTALAAKIQENFEEIGI